MLDMAKTKLRLLLTDAGVMPIKAEEILTRVEAYLIMADARARLEVEAQHT